MLKELKELVNKIECERDVDGEFVREVIGDKIMKLTGKQKIRQLTNDLIGK